MTVIIRVVYHEGVDAPAVVKPHLLIVDDEPDMLDFLERVLRKRFVVSRSACAEEALVCLSASAFDLLITDQKMPRVTGLQLLERIGDQFPRMVKILISGFTESPDIQRARESRRIHHYIFKPVDSEHLLEAIDEAYRSRDRVLA